MHNFQCPSIGTLDSQFEQFVQIPGLAGTNNGALSIDFAGVAHTHQQDVIASCSEHGSNGITQAGFITQDNPQLRRVFLFRLFEFGLCPSGLIHEDRFSIIGLIRF